MTDSSVIKINLVIKDVLTKQHDLDLQRKMDGAG